MNVTRSILQDPYRYPPSGIAFPSFILSLGSQFGTQNHTVDSAYTSIDSPASLNQAWPTSSHRHPSGLGWSHRKKMGWVKGSLPGECNTVWYCTVSNVHQIYPIFKFQVPCLDLYRVIEFHAFCVPVHAFINACQCLPCIQKIGISEFVLHDSLPHSDPKWITCHTLIPNGPLATL